MFYTTFSLLENGKAVHFVNIDYQVLFPIRYMYVLQQRTIYIYYFKNKKLKFSSNLVLKCDCLEALKVIQFEI